MTTIFDVAKLAGVSIKTVSRVANGEANVRDSTRQKVETAIAQLGYSPHRGARMMRAQKSGLFGVVTGAISSSRRRSLEAGLSAIHIVRGIQDVMREAGKIAMIADTGGSADELTHLMQTFAAHSVEAVIYVAEYHQQVVFPLDARVPVVIANGFDAAATPSVVPDDWQGQKIATDYLLEMGHRNILFFGLREELIAARLRRDGFYDAMRTAKHALDHVGYCTADPNDREQFATLVSQEIDECFSKPAPPSAICFGNDLAATRARPIFRQKGLQIGEDISLMGFDNDIALCELYEPTLTTIELPYIEIGRRSAERALAIAAGQPQTGTEKIPCALVARQSVRKI